MAHGDIAFMFDRFDDLPAAGDHRDQRIQLVFSSYRQEGADQREGLNDAFTGNKRSDPSFRRPLCGI